MTEEIANRLLNDFSILPKKNTDPTFMEICQMGGDRFEERCSQILKFYFNPCAAHGLKGLFIDSLLELMQCTDYYSIKSAKVTTEEVTTDNKRIDIIVETDNFVMAIENKIGARLYNPLESYVQHI